MMKGKESPETTEFMLLFARLKDRFDDTPDHLAELGASDEGVKDLCARLSMAAFFLKMNEGRARALFAAPVDPAFLSAWRDYEERYQSVVSEVWLSDLLPEVGTMESSCVPEADRQWNFADDEAKNEASGVEEAIEFARSNADEDQRRGDQSEFIEKIQDGARAWCRLKKETGFDLRGVLRRRELIPFVLVPRKVAAKGGSAEKLSMLKNLQQAHDAFVFGTPFAALALMRSTMEAVLRDHYGAEGEDLCKRIRNARNRLPPRAKEAALHRLRIRANAILHLDQEKHEKLPELDKVGLEKEIVLLLYVLRALIEGVK